MKRYIGLLLMLCLILSVSTVTVQAKKKKAPNLDCTDRMIVLFAEIEAGTSKKITMGNLDNNTKLVKVKHVVANNVTKYKPIHDIYVPVDKLHYYKIYLQSYKGVRKGYWILKYKNGQKIKMRITKE